MTLEEYVKSFGYEVSELTKEELEAARQELENKDNLDVLDGPDFVSMVRMRKIMDTTITEDDLKSYALKCGRDFSAVSDDEKEDWANHILNDRLGLVVND